MPLRPEWSVAGASGTRVPVRGLVDSCRRSSGTEEVFFGEASDVPWGRIADERTASVQRWVNRLLTFAAADPQAGRALLLVIAAIEAGSPSDEAALILAGSVSESGRRTVLLDLEIPEARLSARLDLCHGHGMTDLLTGAAQFDTAIHRVRGSRLHVIPAGLTATLPEEGPVATVFDALAETYDAVVLHVGASDEPRFASWPGAALALVMRPASASSG